jgi:ribosomal protein L22
MTEKPEENPETPEDAIEAAEEAAEPAAADAEKAGTPDEAAAARADAEADADARAEAAEAEDQPKPRRRRKKADAAVDTEAEATAEAEAETEDDEAEEARPAKKRGPRRGSAEAGAKKQRSRRPRGDAEPVFVRAQAKYVRSSPRKARLVVDHIRGKSVEEARAILAHTPRAAAVPVLKVLESAIANAEHNHELLPEELRIHQVMVDEGPTIKRFRPRALGRATKIRKRTSHITINLTNKA